MKRKASLVEVFNKSGGFCAYCDKKLDITKTNTHDAPTIDHVVPKYHGGTNHPANLVCACNECNTRKGHMPLSQFLAILHKRHIRAIT
jgi:5-methylcytosine-specific restriction endonuclease McrA